METKRIRVRLADMRPNPGNPRKDMGDLRSLADSIEATGGQPVNPIVVARDGNVWRIVDGERRYRALLLLAVDSMATDAEAEVLACGSLGDAQEMVAMVATDDKRPLSETERARGVQGMLDLGVGEEVAAKAARVGREQVAAVRRVSKAAPDGTQLTIAQMVAADSMATDAERDAVLAAGEGWEAKARSLERARADREAVEAITAAAAARGVSFADAVPEGMDYAGRVSCADDVDALPEGATLVRAGGSASFWAYEPSDGEESSAAAETRRLADESAAAVAASARRMAAHLKGLLDANPQCRELRALREAVADARRPGCEGSVLELLAPEPAAMPVGAWEMADLAAEMLANLRGLRNGWKDGLVEWKCADYARVYDLVSACGWAPTEEDRELRDLAREGGGGE